MKIYTTNISIKLMSILSFSLMLLISNYFNVYGNVIYVDINAGPTNNGQSWIDAYTDLQFALNSASSGDQIWVAKGMYLPATNGDRSASFNIPDVVEVYGGFAGTESNIGDRTDYGYGQTNETILSGDIVTNGDQTDNSYHVVSFSSSVNSSTILDGFTITNGNSINTDGNSDFDVDGAGILNMGSPNITNCTIQQNNSWSDGGAIYNYSNSESINPSFNNCRIIENSSQVGAGAGICNYAEGGIINSSFNDCIINENNAFQSSGGGIANYSDISGSSTATLNNCKIMGNYALYTGGGIDNENSNDGVSTATLVNCLITGNKVGNGSTQGSGGGISDYCDGSGSTNLSLTNCAIACNYATGSGGGIENDGSPCNPLIKNCIIWNNQENTSTSTVGASVDNKDGASPTFSYSIIANSGGSSSWDGSAGNDDGNNIDQDPEFSGFPDPSGTPTSVGDFHLVIYSPALGSGSPKTDAGVPSSDIEGDSRPLPSSDNNVDIGAYEEYLEGPLPVELSSFSISVNNQSVELQWKTATEVNNYGFDIQREVSSQKSDGSSWEKIGFVKGAGNSNSSKQYSFVDDNHLSGKNEYRLKQIDNDGKFEYSKTIEVTLSTPLQFSLEQNYPNPFNPSTTIKYDIPKEEHVTLKVYDIIGNEVETLINKEQQAGSFQVEFTSQTINHKQLTTGVYLYKLQAGSFIQLKKMLLIK